jgi:type IV secretion system protein VirB9
MKALFKPLAASALLSVVAMAHGAGIPEAGPDDPRVRVIAYKANDVTLIRVQRGTVTRIMLERDEKIQIPVVGLSSDCRSEVDEWCISAVLDSNQIFVRPRDNARRNNMELHTSKRDYSFSFEVVGGSVSHGKRIDSDTPFYRVVFDYPGPKPLAETLSSADRARAAEALLRRVDATASRPHALQDDPDYRMSPEQRLRAEGIQVRNSNYSKQVLEHGEDAEPTMVFDDGRFTYFEFPGAREVPAVFAYGSDGEATRVNWHMDGNFVVVQRTAQKFSLRLGQAVVGIFNEAFDRTGIETPTATMSSAVVREIKGAAQ